MSFFNGCTITDNNSWSLYVLITKNTDLTCKISEMSPSALSDSSTECEFALHESQNQHYYFVHHDWLLHQNMPSERIKSALHLLWYREFRNERAEQKSYLQKCSSALPATPPAQNPACYHDSAKILSLK